MTISLAARWPRITVVTPSFNQGRFLERTIRSVLDQDYPNLEYFVLDGGSTDGSVDVIHRYADRIDFWSSGPDGGQSAAINTGWRRATGDILAWLNSDDFYLPGSLALVGRFAAEHPDSWMVYGKAIEVDAGNRPIRETGIPFSWRKMLFQTNCVPQPTAFVRREVVERVGLVDESLHFAMDYELFLRIGRQHAPDFVDAALAGVTIHPATKSKSGRKSMARERWRVRLRHATPSEVPLLRVGQMASTINHALPPSVLSFVDRLRGV